MAKEKNKQEFLMLAHEWDGDKHGYLGFSMSEKLDGMRAMWDGGISRGLMCDEVPYANIEKHGRYKNTRYATGLWTRYGQPIYAPDWFIQSLPKHVCLDGELTAGRGKHQETVSFCKKLEPLDHEWRQIKYMVFDCPGYLDLFANRKINNTFFKRELWAVPTWCVQRGLDAGLLKASAPYYKSLAYLKTMGLESPVEVLRQVQLPSSRVESQRIIDETLDQVSSEGGEGLILRNTVSIWKPERTHDLLKIKRLHDMEGKIIGYTWADLTDMDRSLTGVATNKLRGMMGSMTLEYVHPDGNRVLRFDLGCGFTEQERMMEDASQYAPGQPVPDDVEAVNFKRGDYITFQYREFTKDGRPKEARHHRKKVLV